MRLARRVLITATYVGLFCIFIFSVNQTLNKNYLYGFVFCLITVAGNLLLPTIIKFFQKKLAQRIPDTIKENSFFSFFTD